MAGLLDFGSPEGLGQLGLIAGLLNARQGDNWPMLLQQHAQAQQMAKQRALQEQLVRQQIETGGMELQKQRQGFQDEQEVRAAMSGAPASGNTPYDRYMGIAQHLRSKGTPAAIKQAMKYEELAQKLKPKYHVVDKGLVPEPDAPGGQVSPAYQAPQDQWDDLERDPVTGQQMQRNKKTGEKKAIGMKPTVVSNTLTASADKSFATQMAEKLANNVDSQRTAAQGANETIRQAQMIRSALDSGKIPAGPGAKFAIAGQQLSAGLFGANPEGLVRTREVVTGLANLALSARKELQGQGQITEKEQALLERARSGDINELSMAEIRRVAELAELGGRVALQRYRATSDKVRKMPGLENVGGLLDVEESGVVDFSELTKGK